MPIFNPPKPLFQRRSPVPFTAPSTGSVGTAAGTSTAVAFTPFGIGSASGISTATAVGASIIAATGTAAGTSTATASSNNIFPLAVSADSRYLIQNDGTPFLVCAQSTWSLAANIPLNEIDSFLNTITGQGFNTVMFNAIEHHYTRVKPPKERSGVLPFTKRMDGATYTGSPNGTNGVSGTAGQFAADPYTSISTQSPDCTFPDNTYWQSVETILNSCLSHNVLVFVWPSYIGFQGNDEGWMSEMVVWDAVIGAGGFAGQPWADGTKSKMWNYGAWLADRWKNYPNIIWVMGGDFGVTDTLNTAQNNALNNLLAGMKSVSGQNSTLFTAHWDRNSISTDKTLPSPHSLNFSYVGEDAAEITRRAYAITPTIPAILGEDFYEGSGLGGSAPYRKYLYWGFLGAIGGGFFGNETLWRIDTNYTSFTNTTATQDAARQFTLFKSKRWWRLRPSGLNSIGTLVTAGGGTASPQSTDYVAAAATPEGDLLMAYVPPAHTGSVTVDMSKLSATIQARWFDPSNATFTNIGAFSNSGTHAFTTPGNNNAGDADWLLVLETVAGSSTATSTATAVGSSLVSQPGSSTGSSTASAVGQSIAAATGSSSGTSTTTSVASALSSGTGTSSGSSTVTATGSPLATGVGSSTASSTSTGVGVSQASSTGASSGNSTVSAVGMSTGDGVGSSAGVSTASASGSSTGSSIGNSSGTSTSLAAGQASSVSTGTATGTSSAIAVGSSVSSGPGTGTSTGIATATGVGAAISASIGLSSNSATVTAVGSSTIFSTGISTGNSTVSGIGSALASSIGLASGLALVTGVGGESPSDTSTGTSSGISTALAIGASLAKAVGSSSGTAQAVGFSPTKKSAFQVPVVRKARVVSASIVSLKRRR